MKVSIVLIVLIVSIVWLSCILLAYADQYNTLGIKHQSLPLTCIFEPHPQITDKSDEIIMAAESAVDGWESALRTHSPNGVWSLYTKVMPVELHHLEDIVTIENSVYNKPWTRNQIKNDIQAEIDTENWVYVMDGLVVGYIFGWIIQDEFHLNNIAVHPEYLRRSIGKALIRHTISTVTYRNIKVILPRYIKNHIKFII